MKMEEIKHIDDFQYFLTRDDQHLFLDENDPDYSKTICGTKLTSQLLYILPGTENLENIQFYNYLKFITINNFKIDNQGFEVLDRHRDKLSGVTHLHIWNIKQKDLRILEFFPNLTHLLISYIRRIDFPFSDLDKAKHLHTLCLLSVNRISDFNFLPPSTKSRIKNLSLNYTSRLTSLDGIEEFKNLENLFLAASTTESRKFVMLQDLNGIEKLSHLKNFEISYFKFDEEELIKKLKPLKNLAEYKIGFNVHKNN